MKVLGIYGSPRKNGNSDILLDKALQGAAEAGAQVEAVVCRKLAISGCLECGGCNETGECVIDDGMQDVYPLMRQADAIILAVPIFFYGSPAQTKALIDRTQAEWSRRLLTKKTKKERKTFDSGNGYLIAVGATQGKNMFVGVELEAKYFFDALDMSYKGGQLVRGVEAKGSVSQLPELLNEAYELGSKIGQLNG